MSVNSNWLKRLRSLEQQLGGKDTFTIDQVARVQIVDDGRYRGSRERAPIARHFSTIAAPAAGHHVGVRIDGVDSLGPNVQVYLQHWQVASGTITAALVPRASLTLEAENEIVPVSIDPDPEVRPRIFEVDVLTANIPTSTTAGNAVSVAFPSIGTQPVTLPASIWWENTNSRSLFFFLNTAEAALSYTVQWQVVRI